MVNVTKEAALMRFKKALAHKLEIKDAIEREFSAKGKKANVVFL